MPAVVAVVALLVASRRGTYVSPDSLFYIGTARNLIDGAGYTAPHGVAPISNFPPLYPLVLAALGAFGPDPLTVARFLSPLLFGVTVLVVGLVVRQLTGSLRLAVAGQLLVASASDLLSYHSAALSEALFLLLALLALIALAASLRSRGTWLVFVAGLLAGMATITRYLGLAVVLAGAVAFVFLAGERRWKSVVAFTFVSLAPLATWLTWVSGAEGRASNRSAVMHAPDADYFLAGLRSASRWVLPGDIWWVIRAAAGGAVVVLLVVAWRRWSPTPSRFSGAPVLALFAAAYLLALLADRWLFEVTGRLDARFLLPVHVVAIVLAMRALARPDGGLTKLASAGLSLVVGLQLAAGASWLYDAWSDPSVRPGGFTSPAWRESTVIDHVRGLPASAAVFTNQADALWFHTRREAEPLPEKSEFLTGRRNRDYESELDAMRTRLGREGVIVYFTASPSRRVFLPTTNELAKRLHLEPVANDEVGIVYRAL